ncbi:MAG TPA: rRNA maturation RNase YbeY [Chthoniobacterales bacterium]
MKSSSASLPKIYVHNRQRKVAIDRVALENFARWALPFCATERGPGLTNLEEVNILLISDRRIAQLHQRFMQIAGPTDVITFQHGEIFISVETAKRQARTHHTSVLHELQLYLVHGLLHLRGFDDRDPQARRKMQAVQEKIMAASES